MANSAEITILVGGTRIKVSDDGYGEYPLRISAFGEGWSTVAVAGDAVDIRALARALTTIANFHEEGRSDG